MASRTPPGARAQAGDPRRQVPADVRPLVGSPPRTLPWWIVAGGVAVAAILLFVLLDSRRRALTAPATKVRASDAYARAAAPPPSLFVPPEPVLPVVTAAVEAPPPPVEPPAPLPLAPIYIPPPPPSVPLDLPPSAPEVRRGTGESALVFDGTRGAEAGDIVPGLPPGVAGGGAPVAATASGPTRATMLRQRTNVVPQGTLIPAVLETAIDSTRPGLARGLVQSDVRGFDGTKVLIPRGSRLIGDYRADLAPGQKRAAVMWTRLVRPDGATIALQSPAADTLGRSGIKGRVNSHFFSRLTSAILQTSLDVGVALAGRSGSGNSAVVIGSLPSAASGGGSLLAGNSPPQPTVMVRQGTAIMVFVARDLDFTAVEAAR